MEVKDMVSLRLYLCGHSEKNRTLLNNLKVMLNRHVGDTFELAVIDVLQNADMADRDNIWATPALVRSKPDPVKKIVGDVFDENALKSLLQAA
jgi:circadian clock protein KaiB